MAEDDQILIGEDFELAISCKPSYNGVGYNPFLDVFFPGTTYYLEQFQVRIADKITPFYIVSLYPNY